jgi:uncharacterized protein with HEPN domain
MNPDIGKILEQNRDKLIKAIHLVDASLQRVGALDGLKTNTPEELEPYDALCDRFIRAVEVGIRYFRTVEYFEFAESSDTLRDLLNRMEKMNLVSSVRIWLEMRDVRNRIVHDYSSASFTEIIQDIRSAFGGELLMLRKRVLGVVS